MHIASIGIDLGKTTFHLGASGERNKILLGRKFSRSQLLAYTANLPASLVGLEACAGAHFLGTVPREQGHQVRLIPAQFVKPYRKSNKNDFIDAEAIAKPWRSRTCALCRSRPRSNSIGRPCTGCGIDSPASHRTAQRDPWLSVGAWHHLSGAAYSPAQKSPHSGGRC
jgi:hypothetical protein